MPLQTESDTVRYCRYPGPACVDDQPNNAEVRPVSQLRWVELQRGSRAAQGALIGAGIGVAVVVLGRWAFSDDDSPAPWTGERVAGAITFVALGAGIGALIGQKSARWVSAAP
jgi:hypothetical protein